jgi:hypothetical protein
MKIAKLKNWNVFLSNGDFLMTLSYTKAQIRKAFPGATIRGLSVTLA